MAFKFWVRSAEWTDEAKALPPATRVACAAGAPSPIAAPPVEMDVLDLWLDAPSPAERSGAQNAALARMETTDREALAAARAEKRFAPMPEMAYHVRLWQLYRSSGTASFPRQTRRSGSRSADRICRRWSVSGRKTVPSASNDF